MVVHWGMEAGNGEGSGVGMGAHRERTQLVTAIPVARSIARAILTPFTKGQRIPKVCAAMPPCNATLHREAHV